MKRLFNVPLVIALLFCTMLFLFLFQLHQEPFVTVKETFNRAIQKSENGKPAYTANYISTVRQVYTDKLLLKNISLDSTVNNNSLFMLSLHQIVGNFSVNANPYPLVNKGKDETLSCTFKMIASKNFMLQIELKKVNGVYLFDKISNLDLLLASHPEYLNALATGRINE